VPSLVRSADFAQLWEGVVTVEARGDDLSSSLSREVDLRFRLPLAYFFS
jgi:hypothetical protein